MNIEPIENWMITHCPNNKTVKHIFSYLKSKHISRHKMKKNDVDAVDSGRIKKEIILKKYEKKWYRYDKKVKKHISEELVLYRRENSEKEILTRDILYCKYAYGFNPDEYFMYNLKNKSPVERKKFISDKDRLEFIYKVNDIIDMDVVRNKNLTYKNFQKFYQRKALCITKNTELKDFINFVKNTPIFVQKNVRKNCGQGVKLIDFNKMGSTYKDYFQYLKKTDEYILEELIIQSNTMSNLNDSSVNTVRCVTLVTDKGVLIDHCFLKVGRNHSFLDNGAAGGLLIGIDKNSGMLNTDAYNEFNEVFVQHPDSHIIFKGYQLPEWQGLLDTATALAEKCPTVRFVGWDLAHTDNGWILVEGNGRSQLIGPQLLYDLGLKSHLSKTMNIQL